MKLESIKISGWRSFDDSGVTLENLKKINVIIGQNNAGKSNFGKYFLYLKQIATSKQARRFEECYDHYNYHVSEIDACDTWAWQEKEFSCVLTLAKEPMLWESSSPHFCSKNENIQLCALHSPFYKYSSLRVEVNGNHLTKVDNQGIATYWNPSNKAYIDFRENLKGGYDTYLYWKRFVDSLVFVDPIRHFDRTSSATIECLFDGAAILKELSAIQINNRLAWNGFCAAMAKWLKEILCEEVHQISIVSHSQFRLNIKRGGEIITSTLQELGTGVSQIVMLLAHLYLNKNRELNVFVDEPESNLHPGSVARLVNIFEHDLPNHTFFITTHSSALIDQISDNWSVHTVSREGEQSSTVYPCVLPIHKFELLDDLGIRASQVLQSNIIIWVEGPSDAIYLRKWIADISAGEVRPSEHFTFLFYGGSNLRSHSLLTDVHSAAVDLLSTSRYAVIFCDTDYKSVTAASSGALKPRVQSIIERLKDVAAANIGRRGNLQDFVKIWLTDGRETENYIPEDLLFNILSQPPFRKEEMEISGSAVPRRKVKVDFGTRGQLNFGKFDSFDQCFSKMYLWEDGSTVDASSLAKIADKYASAKVEIAKAVVKQWEGSHYSAQLQAEIVDLITLVKRANGML